MNILFLTSSLPRHKGDSQVPFVWEQALAWKKACPQDQIFIIAPHDVSAKKEEVVSGIQIFRFVYWLPKKWQALAYPAILPNIYKNPLLIFQIPFFLLSELMTTIKTVKRYEINLIFAHWVMPQGLIAYLVKLLCKIPYGLKNYSSDVRVFHKLSFLGRWFARKIISNSKVMFCENSLLKNEALDYFCENERPEISAKITALCMGVNEAASTRSLEAPETYEYDFGFIGRLSVKKGINHFFDALLSLELPFKASVAGGGEEKDNLLRRRRNLNIDFVGFVSGDEKAEYLQKAKCFVFPSVATSGGDVEGMPVAMLEALYSGKLVIASTDTNIQLLPEWKMLKDYILFLEDPRDTAAFVNLLKQALSITSEELDTRSERIKAIFDRYGWTNLIHEYINPLLAK